MNLVKLSYDDQIVVVSMANGEKNPLSVALFTELVTALEQVEKFPDAIGMIFTSESKRFLSIGLDLPSLFLLDKQEFLEAYRALNLTSFKLLTVRIPTVCAITGHAPAGGCILALMCDYRIMSEGRKWIGLNEIKLGLNIPLLAHEALRMICNERAAREMAYTGNFLGPEKSLEIGLVDEVVPEQDLMQAAMRKVKSIGSSFMPAFSMIKETRVSMLRKIFEEGKEQDERSFLELWFKEEVRTNLKKAMTQF